MKIPIQKYAPTCTSVLNETLESQELPEFKVECTTSKDTTIKFHLKSNNSMLQLNGNVSNDGENTEFNTRDHPHYQQMLNIFQTKFGLHLFRPCQLSAINAAILGNDCFVLMPTGGGKSLCYQLPALMAKGVTIVITPLKSLMYDQVQKLLSLGIPAMYFTGDQTDDEQNLVYQKLYKANFELRLLYVTPEKISSSSKLMETLDFLYKQGTIVRFVIDEVHCVSLWGHDFRPAYKELSMLRQRFPDVPLMALTATATQRVRTDILYQLNVKSPKWFISSFNRSNLRYSVLAKLTKSATDQITEIIEKKFSKHCGIVYCISRQECEDLAQTLKDNGLKASSYHAGLSSEIRIERQTQWMSEKVNIIVATIAFGMGIDKPNVRFVIHSGLPKSIEAYYQESGRAGRDGEPAECILFYRYDDYHRYRTMCQKNKNTNPRIYETQMENLNKIILFCDNMVDCRRALQLNYFGEKFDRQNCIENKETTCDNCQTYDQLEDWNVTDHAKKLTQLIQYLSHKRENCVTMLQVMNFYKGWKVSQVSEKLGSEYRRWHGQGNSMTKCEIERLLLKLVINNYLSENMVVNNGIVCHYLALGTLADKLLNSCDVQIFLQKKKPVQNPEISVPSELLMSAVTNVALKDIQQRCYEELIDTINNIRSATEVLENFSMNIVALEISRKLPTSQTTMMEIPNFTKTNCEKYGKAFLDITKKFTKERDNILKDEREMNDYQDLYIVGNNSVGSSTTNKNRKRRRRNRSRQMKRYKRNNSIGNGCSTAEPSNAALTNARTNGTRKNNRCSDLMNRFGGDGARPH